jgi:hypothetical protein
LVSQTTFQHNQEVRYDGSVPLGSRQTLRYGGEFVNVPEFTFVAFFEDGAMLNALSSATPSNAFPGGASNPLNYPLSSVVFGNGLGYVSEKPGLGFPHGAFPGTRTGAYIADVWKAKPNLTATFGLRYNRITGRTDSDARGLPSLESLSLAPVMLLICPISVLLLNWELPGIPSRTERPRCALALESSGTIT